MRHSATLVDCVKIYNMVVTLEQMCNEMQAVDIEDDHAVAVNIFQPLMETLDGFQKLKEMIEDSIDIGRARQNDYVIKADFDEELKVCRANMDKVLKKIEDTRQEVEDDLGVSKRISLTDSNQFIYLFEVNKKEGDAGFRKSKN